MAATAWVTGTSNDGLMRLRQLGEHVNAPSPPPQLVVTYRP